MPYEAAAVQSFAFITLDFVHCSLVMYYNWYFIFNQRSGLALCQKLVISASWDRGILNAGQGCTFELLPCRSCHTGKKSSRLGFYRLTFQRWKGFWHWGPSQSGTPHLHSLRYSSRKAKSLYWLFFFLESSDFPKKKKMTFSFKWCLE